MSLEQAYDQKRAECASLIERLDAVEHDRDNLLNQVVMLREALGRAETYLVQRGIESHGVVGRTEVLPAIREALAATADLDRYTLLATNLRQQLAHMTDDAAGLRVQLREAERRRDELALIIATDTGTEGAVAELQRQRDELWAALENCRLLAARQRKKVWAEFVLRYCSDVGVTGSPLRTAAARNG